MIRALAIVAAQRELNRKMLLDAADRRQAWLRSDLVVLLFCINMQVRFLSPPFGPAALHLKGVAPPEINLIEIYRSFGPFVGLELLVLMLVLFFPGLATALR